MIIRMVIVMQWGVRMGIVVVGLFVVMMVIDGRC